MSAIGKLALALFLILVAVVIYENWPTGGTPTGGAPTGGGQTQPTGKDVGDCTVGGHISHGKTLDECRDMGGSIFKPNDPNKETVDPSKVGTLNP